MLVRPKLNAIPFLVCFVCVLLMTSCNKDDETPVPVAFANVDPALIPYFERFEQEAAARGFQIDVNALGTVGQIAELGSGSIAGQCSYQSHLPNEITIDASFWTNASGLWKEFVVFHELGHCVLSRDHKESFHPDGTCVSIMRSGNGQCHDNYTPSTRASYLNELFFEQ